MSKLTNNLLEHIFSYLKIIITLLIMYYLGWVKGIITCILINKFYKFFMWKIFKLESLIGIDKYFVGRNSREKVTILCLMVFSDYNEEKLKSLLINKAFKQLPKLKKKLIYKFFDYYWADASLEEAIKRIKLIEMDLDFYEKNEDNCESINKELLKYIQKEVNSHIDVFNEMPYEIQLIKLRNDKGAMIFKFDHSLSDGLGASSAICSLADNFDKSIFPPVMRNMSDGQIPIYKIIYYYVSFIFYIPKFLYVFFFLNIENSPFRKVKELSTGRCQFTLSKAYDLSLIENFRKKFNLTFNEFFISVLSKATHTLIQQNNTENCENVEINKNFERNHIKCVMAIGNKPIPKNISHVQLNNQALGTAFKLPIIQSFHQGKDQIKQVLKSSIKNISFVTAPGIFSKVFAQYAPMDWIHWIQDFSLNTVDLLLSNVPGPVKPLIMSGCKMEFVAPFASNSRSKAFVPILSYNNQFRFIFTVDEISGLDHENFVKIVEAELDSLIKAE
jgi:hypothetical protein